MKIDVLIPVLSTAFQKERNSNNYKLLGTVTVLREIELVGYGDNGYGLIPWGGSLEDIPRGVKEAHWIDYASGKNLENLAQLFNIRRNTDETNMHFRARIKVQYQKHAAHATHKEIKDICATVLKTTTARIEITDIYPARFNLKVFTSDLEDAELSEAEFKEIIGEIKPAGVRITSFRIGTFECLEIGGSHDASKAYNNLADANPDGGTYSGFI